MGLFSKVKKKNAPEVKSLKTAKRVVFEQLHEVKDSHLTKLATGVINGEPLIVNLESLNTDEANKVIWFFTGVVYAIDGEYYVISEKILLFGNNELYDDGSIKKLLAEIEKK